MESGFYAAAQSLQALGTSQQAVAANLSNALTSGYKRVVTAFHEELEKAEGAARAEGPTLAQARDFGQGPLRETESPFDVALAGDGFLAVETDRGVRWARGGTLGVEPDGGLTLGGGRLIGEAGPLKLPEPAGDFHIDAKGVLSQGGEEIGVLRRARFEEPMPLFADGHGLYLETVADSAKPVGEDLAVRHRFREESNVSVVDEMVALVAINRAFEAATKAIQARGRTTERLTQSGV